MFTGIVEEMGTVASLQLDAEVRLWDGSTATGAVLSITAATVLQEAYIGCSIAVNGACLTVTAFDAGTFTVNLAPETLRRTNLATLRVGDRVNLERAAAANSRNSGHVVQGHVDTTAEIVERRPDGESLWMVARLSPEYLRYLVPKGYVAVDGTSLTVIDVDRAASTFSFMLVAHTQRHVVIPSRQVGDKVNIEVDVLAKYVEANLGNVMERLSKVEKWMQSVAAAGGTGVAAAPASASAAAPHAVLTGDRDEEMREIKRQTQQTVHGAGLNVPLPAREICGRLKVAIAYTCWHAELINEMRSRCRSRLVDCGVKPENIIERACPGSFELPYAAKYCATEADVVICIGILIKGGTIHMEVIANAVTQSLMQLQFQVDRPIIFGVLTTLSVDQARERAFSPLAASWAESALCMSQLSTRSDYVV